MPSASCQFHLGKGFLKDQIIEMKKLGLILREMPGRLEDKYAEDGLNRQRSS